jgi:hypothetical protein
MRILVATLGMMLVLAACGGSDTGTPVPAPSVENPASAPLWLAELETINADLAEDSSRAISNGENVCLDIEQGKDSATVLKNLKARFEVNDAEARKILDATTKRICPTK